MVRKVAFLVGLGTGYVLGARSGRERYDQIVDSAQQVWKNPRVKKTAEQAQEVVQDVAGQAGQAVKEKVASVTPSGDDVADGSDSPRASLTRTGGGTLP